MSVVQRVAIVTAVLAAAGCSIGPQAIRFEPAMGPRGVATTFITRSGEERVGELLEVRDTGLLLDTEKSIVFVAYDSLASATFKNMDVKLGGYRPPSEKKRRTLRVISRFPQGLEPALSQKLLEAHGQSEARQVR